MTGYFSGWFSIPAIAAFPTRSHKDTAFPNIFNGDLTFYFKHEWDFRVMGIAHQSIVNQLILCSAMSCLIECLLADKRG